MVSGRALRDLATLSRLPEEVHLVGSHGTEFDVGFRQQLDRGAGAARARHGWLRAIAALRRACGGAQARRRAVHYPAGLRGGRRRRVDTVRDGPARLPGVIAARASW